MTNDKKIKGIKIPKECGKAEKYELTAIMYHDENVDAEMKECTVFITEEDYKDGKIFVTVSGNMNPKRVVNRDRDTHIYVKSDKVEPIISEEDFERVRQKNWHAEHRNSKSTGTQRNPGNEVVRQQTIR